MISKSHRFQNSGIRSCGKKKLLRYNISFKRDFNLAEPMGNSCARQLMEIKLSTIIMESRLRRRSAAPPCRAKGEGRRQRTRATRENRCRFDVVVEEERKMKKERECAFASKSEKLVACLPELGRDRAGKGEAAADEDDDDEEKERIEQMEGERKSERDGEERRSVFVWSRRRTRSHTRALLRSPFAPPPQDVDSHECTNTSRDLKPLRLLPAPSPRQPHHDPTFSPSPPPIDSGRRAPRGAPALFSPFCFIFILFLLFFSSWTRSLSRAARCGGHA